MPVTRLKGGIHICTVKFAILCMSVMYWRSIVTAITEIPLCKKAFAWNSAIKSGIHAMKSGILMLLALVLVEPINLLVQPYVLEDVQLIVHEPCTMIAMMIFFCGVG